jgi:hypothetical protein
VAAGPVEEARAGNVVQSEIREVVDGFAMECQLLFRHFFHRRFSWLGNGASAAPWLYLGDAAMREENRQESGANVFRVVSLFG